MQYTAVVLRQELMVHQDIGHQPRTTCQQCNRELDAGPSPRWTLWPVVARGQRLDTLARTILGHTSANLGVSEMRPSRCGWFYQRIRKTFRWPEEHILCHASWIHTQK